MRLERTAGSASAIDVLDHVLDKGIVIDTWLRVSLAGLSLITVEARVLVASIETYLRHAEAVAQIAPLSQSLLTPASPRESSKTKFGSD